MAVFTWSVCLTFAKDVDRTLVRPLAVVGPVGGASRVLAFRKMLFFLVISFHDK